MQNKEFWQNLKYFSPIENWGNASAMDESLILKLEEFRDFIKVPMIILCGNQGVHSSKSYHYIENGSCAVDVIIPDYSKSAVDLILDACRFNFRGLGYYPHWTYKNQKGNGLHLDTRNAAPARWMGVRDETGKQIYIELSYDNIKKHGG